VKLEKNVTLVQYFLRLKGEEAMKNSSDFEWHKLFEVGRENVEDDKRSGRPRPHITNENVEKVLKLMPSHRPNSRPSLLRGNTEAVAWICPYKMARTVTQRLDSSP
jgi:hypothetical protein